MWLGRRIEIVGRGGRGRMVLIYVQHRLVAQMSGGILRKCCKGRGGGVGRSRGILEDSGGNCVREGRGYAGPDLAYEMADVATEEEECAGGFRSCSGKPVDGA